LGIVEGLTGTCLASPAFQDGAPAYRQALNLAWYRAGRKGPHVKGNYLTGRPRPLGRGVSLSGNNYLIIWININQLKPFLYTSKIRNKTKIK